MVVMNFFEEHADHYYSNGIVATISVEFVARLMKFQILDSSGYLTADEIKGTKKVLTAAALTYVAALITALLQLLRLVSMFSRRR